MVVPVAPEVVIVDEVPQGTPGIDPPEVVPVVDEVVPELHQPSPSTTSPPSRPLALEERKKTHLMITHSHPRV